MKKILLFTLLFFGVCNAQAGKRNIGEMKQVARSVIRSINRSTTRSTLANAPLDVLHEASQFTIIGGKQGFAIIANDDKFEAVLGYSETAYDSNNVAPGFRWWMKAMNDQLAYNLEHGISMTSETPANQGFAQSVDALIKTKWGQGAPYNDQTPTYTSGSGKDKQEVHYVTGCVATAMAQIMYYHKWPEKGKGYVSYYFTPEGSDASQKLSANLAQAPYKWDDMLLNYSTTSYTEEQAKAVSTLMMHCGYGVMMQYTKDGSGAYTHDAVDAMRKRFYYHNNMHFYWRDFFPIDEWMKIIYSELNEGCPILYGGRSKSGGHEFILDGYDETGKIHVNWGWNGSQDGYFDIASLNGYNNGQEMALIRKNDAEVAYHSCWGIDGSLTTNISVQTNLKVNFQAYNFDYNSFVGEIAVVLQDLKTNKIEVLSKSVISEPVEYLNGKGFEFTGINITGMTDGDYRLYAASMATDKENEWQPIRCIETSNNSYLVNISAGKVKITGENNPNWTAGTTAIQSITNQNDFIKNQTIYDLRGHQVGTNPDALPKGIYIINGKKVVK